MTKQVFDKSRVENDPSNTPLQTANKYRKRQVELDNDALKELGSSVIIDEGDNEPPLDASQEKPSGKSVDWEKRYGDLRSHSSHKEQEFRNMISSLEEKVNKASNAPLEYPKTEDEVKEWIENYPDVAGIIQTIAGKSSDQAVREVQQDLKIVKEERKLLAFQRAYTQLLALQPDFDTIRNDIKFTEFDDSGALVSGWLYEQPISLQEAILKPSFDEAGVRFASRVIDLYKRDFGLDKRKSTPKDDTREAAKMVSKNNSDTPNNSDDSQPRFSESQVAKMTSKEFERQMDKISEAQKSGRFVYDISGAAR